VKISEVFPIEHYSYFTYLWRFTLPIPVHASELCPETIQSNSHSKNIRWSPHLMFFKLRFSVI
jgi:hypothetical protein